MNLKKILICIIIQTIIEIASTIEDGFECVKRKSGACKSITVPEEFEHFIDLHPFKFGEKSRISTIIEIDYLENKRSYELKKIKEIKESDVDNNPVIEILFSEDKNNIHCYRLVLGEKLNRIAILEVTEYEQFTKYNTYSPDLPTWPFAINVTIDSAYTGSRESNWSVFTRNSDGFDKTTPFLRGESKYINVRYLSMRSRNKNVKLVGFYDCSTQYGNNCGIERTQIITDCWQKFSPIGSGFFYNFVNMSRFNRLGYKKSALGIFDYNEIFGIYRRNNDNVHILFVSQTHEDDTYIQLTIGADIAARLRTYSHDKDEFYEKTSVTKGWRQEPSEPNFIRVHLSTESRQLSIYNVNTTAEDGNEEPILTMKLCNYFDDNATVKYMSVTSDHLTTVDLYYDCCSPNEMEDCHIGKDCDDGDRDGYCDFYNDDEYDEIHSDQCELKTLDGGIVMSRTFLNTSDFDGPWTTLYTYKNGSSKIDYCPEDIVGADLTPSEKMSDADDDDYDADDDVDSVDDEKDVQSPAPSVA